MRLLDTSSDPAPAVYAALKQQPGPHLAEVEATAREIVEAVRERGDEAVREFHLKYDGVRLDDLEVPRDEWERALGTLDRRDLEAMQAARDAIEQFHLRQARGSWEEEFEGARLGQKVRPLDRAGIIVPGGKAPLFSTLLMAAVPARVAGVGEIIACSPPRGDGSAHPAVLAAASIAGIDRFFRIGGAQGVAAMAWGTRSVPRVDKIVGPGNPYTVMAKKLVFGSVGIESLPGPTEIVIIADSTADPDWIAADLLSQAEHASDSLAVLLTPDRKLAESVISRVSAQLATLPRQAIAGECMERQGWAIVTRDLAEACELCNLCAPEHVELLVEHPQGWVEALVHAGAVFVGGYSAEAIGDYIAGPSHILPTGGTARFSSPLNVDDFLKKTNVIQYSWEAFERDAPHAARLARLEGLEGHARAIESRLPATARSTPGQ